MILVVIGHSDMTDNFKQLWIYKWVYSFHMPLFFFISGFLFCLTNDYERIKNTGYTSFLFKKAKRLLLPFIFISSIIFVIKSLFIHDKSMMQHPIEFNINSFIDIFFSPLGYMWFLPTLFMIFVIAYPILTMIQKYRYQNYYNSQALNISIALLVVFFWILSIYCPGISFMQISSAFNFTPYFLLGILYCLNKTEIDSLLKRYWIICIPIALLISTSLWLSGFIAALIGILFCVSAALITEQKFDDRVIDFSQLSYAVFLLSYFPQMLIRGPISSRFLEVNEYVFSFISFVSGIIIPLLICKLYDKIKHRNKQISNLGLLIGL